MDNLSSPLRSTPILDTVRANAYVSGKYQEFSKGVCTLNFYSTFLKMLLQYWNDFFELL